ncbi:MAG: hypothetical protein M1814_006114 [Vezdaea aestivalis]|nr:MAG: hypothetical protein M1814_006114 [Vezdaea aestivalis]
MPAIKQIEVRKRGNRSIEPKAEPKSLVKISADSSQNPTKEFPEKEPRETKRAKHDLGVHVSSEQGTERQAGVKSQNISRSLASEKRATYPEYTEEPRLNSSSERHSSLSEVEESSHSQMQSRPNSGRNLIFAGQKIGSTHQEEDRGTVQAESTQSFRLEEGQIDESKTHKSLPLSPTKSSSTWSSPSRSNNLETSRGSIAKPATGRRVSSINSFLSSMNSPIKQWSFSQRLNQWKGQKKQDANIGLSQLGTPKTAATPRSKQSFENFESQPQTTSFSKSLTSKNSAMSVKESLPAKQLRRATTSIPVRALGTLKEAKRARSFCVNDHVSHGYSHTHKKQTETHATRTTHHRKHKTSRGIVGVKVVVILEGGREVEVQTSITGQEWERIRSVSSSTCDSVPSC